MHFRRQKHYFALLCSVAMISQTSICPLFLNVDCYPTSCAPSLELGAVLGLWTPSGTQTKRRPSNSSAQRGDHRGIGNLPLLGATKIHRPAKSSSIKSRRWEQWAVNQTPFVAPRSPSRPPVRPVAGAEGGGGGRVHRAPCPSHRAGHAPPLPAARGGLPDQKDWLQGPIQRIPSGVSNSQTPQIPGGFEA